MGEGDRRRFVRAARGGAALGLVLFALLLTYGRPWNLAPTEALGNFYDAQADAFVDGHLDVDPQEVTFEGFRIGDRTYTYFGPVPALMRVPVVAVTDRFHGQLTRVSMLAAYVLALWFATRLQWRVRAAVRPDRSVTARDAWLGAITGFAIATSSLLFLASKAWVYHEAILWGVAFALGSYDQLLAWLAATDTRVPTPSAEVESAQGDPSSVRASARLTTSSTRRMGVTRHAWWASALAGLSLLSRASVGAGAVAALGITLVVLGTQALIARRARANEGAGSERLARLAGWRPVGALGLVALAAGVVVPVAAYAGLNHAKFGTWLSLPVDKQVLVAYDRDRQVALADNGGSLFGLRYAPSVALQVARPDAFDLQASVPYIGFPATRPSVVGDVVFAERDFSSSIPVSEPLLALGALVGLVALVAPRRLTGARDVALMRIPVAGAIIGGSTVLVFGYIANRYLNDLLPLAVLAGLTGIEVVAARADRARSTTPWKAVLGAAGALALFGAWINVGTGLQYQREIAPAPPTGARSEWLRLQATLGAGPEVVDVAADAALPPDAPLGTVAVVAPCAGVYRGDGTRWQRVESHEGTGDHLREVTFTRVPTSDVTVLEGAGPDGTDRLIVAPLGDGRVRFVAEVERDGTTTRTLPGPAFRVVPGQAMTLDMLVDWRIGYAEVVDRDSGESLLSVTADFAPAPVSEAEGFPGTLKPIGTGRSVCDAIGRR